jgi:guanylate kinase
VGRIFAICGPSGAGKSSLIQGFFKLKPDNARLLCRTTARPPRKGEVNNAEFQFTDTEGFLRMVFANEFVDFVEYDGHPYGIRLRPIEETIRSNHDGLIMAGTSGAVNLKGKFREAITIVYVYTGSLDDLMDPGSLDPNSDASRELVWRLHKKIEQGQLQPKGDIETYITGRMKRSFLGIAFLNGQLRSGLEVHVLHNHRDALEDTVAAFATLRNVTSSPADRDSSMRATCFVLMPFKEPFDAIYEDHIEPVVSNLGIKPLRGDRIFSTKPIMEDIREAVKHAQVVISDLTGGNPNVYYETGLCHAIGKEVVLISQDDNAPFDVQHFRRIRYKYTPRGMRQFEEDLESTLREVSHLAITSPS